MKAAPGLRDAQRLLYPRLLQFGIDYAELLALEHQLEAGDWSAWSGRLADRAEDYQRRGGASYGQGRHESAAIFFRRACDTFHFAAMREPVRSARDSRAAASVECFARWREVAQPPLDSFRFDYAGTSAEVLYSAPANAAPTVLLLGGLDSAKECELWYFSRIFAARGLGVALADLPGQGSLLGQLGLTEHGELYAKVLVAELLRRSRASQIGVFGVSLGGYLALRTAATAMGVSAVVSLGGFFDSSVFANLSEAARPLLHEALLATCADPAEHDLAAVSLATAAESLSVRALIVHGEYDHLVSLEQVSLMAQWAKRSEIMVVPGAEHVATSRFATLLPEIGDWMAEALTNGLG